MDVRTSFIVAVFWNYKRPNHLQDSFEYSILYETGIFKNCRSSFTSVIVLLLLVIMIVIIIIIVIVIVTVIAIVIAIVVVVVVVIVVVIVVVVVVVVVVVGAPSRPGDPRPMRRTTSRPGHPWEHIYIYIYMTEGRLKNSTEQSEALMLQVCCCCLGEVSSDRRSPKERKAKPRPAYGRLGYGRLFPRRTFWDTAI